MSGGKGPDLKRYMERRMSVKLVANRRVTGTLRGYDQFMNLVLDDAIEDVSSTEQNDIGRVVVRGNSVIEFELLEKEVQIDRCTGQVVG